MTSEPLPDIPPAPADQQDLKPEEGELPTDLSHFSQRLASFGLGESPDPLLTEAHPPAKRRAED